MGARPGHVLRRPDARCLVPRAAPRPGRPADVADAYLRLQLISHRLLKPHEANLDGIFGVLANVAWTSAGPVDPAQLDAVRLRFRGSGEWLQVHGVDKFPRM